MRDVVFTNKFNSFWIIVNCFIIDYLTTTIWCTYSVYYNEFVDRFGNDNNIVEWIWTIQGLLLGTIRKFMQCQGYLNIWYIYINIHRTMEILNLEQWPFLRKNRLWGLRSGRSTTLYTILRVTDWNSINIHFVF